MSKSQAKLPRGPPKEDIRTAEGLVCIGIRGDILYGTVGSRDDTGITLVDCLEESRRICWGIGFAEVYSTFERKPRITVPYSCIEYARRISGLDIPGN